MMWLHLPTRGLSRWVCDFRNKNVIEDKSVKFQALTGVLALHFDHFHRFSTKLRQIIHCDYILT